MEADFIGKFALQRIREIGITRKQVGLVLDCDPMAGPNTRFWAIAHEGESVGKVTSAVYSPRLEKNIALAMVDVEHAELGTVLTVLTHAGEVTAQVVEKPFFDPRKSIAVSGAPDAAPVAATQDLRA
jgi:glycine cleavage system aminomethyltransferase T